MEFEIKDLVQPVAGESLVVQCNKCDTQFKTAKASAIKRHYETRHEYKFTSVRDRKRGSDLGCLVPAKVQRLHELPIDFDNVNEYLNTCSQLQCNAALPFAFWDIREVQRLHGPYTAHYGISVNSKFN